MKITVITLFPAMIDPFVKESIIKRAQEKGVVEIAVINLRDFAKDSYGTVDDKPYGGGAGMVLRGDVLHEAIAKAGNGHVVLTSAKGNPYTQEKAREFSKLEHLVIVAGHYEGVDERIMKEIHEEVSLGDFVMTGGEIAVAAILDSVARLVPGALKKDEATDIESFKSYTVSDIERAVGFHSTLESLKERKIESVKLLEYPHYTRPELLDGEGVPEILTSGDHKKIESWRLKMAFEETLTKRPDLLGK